MAQDPESSEEADDLVKRLDEVSVPQTPELPSVPDIKFHRPGTYKSDDGGHNVTVSIGQDRLGGKKSQGLSTNSNAVSMGAAMGAGVSFATSIVVGFLIGQWLDHKFSLDRGGIPWCTLVMVLAGMAVGFINIIRLSNASDQNSKK